MVKEKKILSYFIGWLVLGFIICFIGINNTYAATTTTYENIGYLNDVTVLYSLADDPPYPLEIPRGGEYQLYNVEKIMVQIDNYTFSGGTTYNLELSLPISTLTNNIYSVIDENGNKCSIGTTDSSNSSYPNYSFNCSKNSNSLTLNIYNTDGSDVLDAGIFRWNYIYLRKQLTTTDTSILENQTSQIIDQNQQIIQGQDEIKDTIKDELNSCRESVNIFSTYFIQGAWAFADGHFFGSSQYIATNDFINVTPGKTYTLSFESNKNLNTGSGYIYFNDGTYVSYAMTSVKTFTIPNDVNQIKINLFNSDGVSPNDVTNIQLQEGSVATNYEPYGEEICTNKLDETNDKLNDLNNSLNNPNVNDSLGSAGNFFDNFNTSDHGGLSGIITAPLVAINQMLNTSCSPMTTTFKGKELSLPCGYEFWNKMGPIQDFVNLVLGGLLCYQIIIKLYKLIEKIKNPEDDRLEVMDL